VTHEASLERQLAQAQKLEAVGRLAGGVAHDFNNLLGVITGYGEILRDRLDGQDALRGKMDLILQASARAASLTRQLLAFSRQQVLQPKVLDLNLVVAETEKMLHRLIGEDVELVTVLDPDLEHVKADPGQLEQIIMNLAVNARDAMPDGGRLTLRTENVEGDAVDLPRGRYAALVVSDTGTGMDADIQSHVFEPFFTTKDVGKGTGLGLATVYGIVKQSGGHVMLHSEPGEGTTFRIVLPAAEEPVSSSAEARASRSHAKAWQTVLLIEDDDVLRGALGETLREEGYTVLVAGGGREAILLATQHAGPIHAVVSDVIMPGMAGPEAVRQLTASRPDLKALFMSGYTDEAVARHGVLGPGSAFMSKPFPKDALLRRLLDLLQGPAPAA
jgi:two-component system cell cycle sensor histidine kinase/response regulator CckA